ncbi:host specificity factor TipJ family phage tail protein [Propionispora vibrioides]|uniref:Phage-related protein, tail component n=1 Tax=Propionispora vibrioides TaxID=112903 RepID=A0A1H8XA87_9FIRM|nr:host specificity factor TipJ family phage tail protein [Propionispora vibrioides]SEP36844.1 Phage-related protein, tail component [Propionispora vibrioides]
MISLTILKNPFNYNEKELHTCEYVPGKTVYEYIQPYVMGLEEYIVSANGDIVENIQTQQVTSGDWLAVCPVVGKSGKDWFRMIGTLALGYATGSLAKTWGGKFWANMAAGAIGIAGGMLLNHWFPPAKADQATVQTNSSYNWSNAQSQSGQGNALAVTYGTMRTAGQILAQHISSNDEEQYMNILLCGGEGPIDSISDIRINDNPVSYYKDVVVETRLGANDQSAIANFNDTYDDQPLAYELNADNTWATQQTEGNAVQGLEVTLQFPGGLYYINDNSSLGNASVTVKLQYRKVGDTNWNDFTTAVITAAKNTEFFRTYRLDHLSAAQYEVRAQCTAKSGTTTRHSTRVYWSQLSSIMYDDFARPGKVLIGIKALATSQLSGGTPVVTWLQTRSQVWVWNPESNAYEQKAASNPAWAAYDMIHRCRQIKNIHTGNNEFVVQGAPAARAMYQDFVRWAAFCDDRKLTFDYIFDTANDLWSLLQKPEGVGRGKVIMRGTKFGCVCDAPGEPVQLFTVGNILTDKFKETFVSLKDRANAIEVSFSNKNKAYEKEIITVYADDYEKADGPNITQITLDGATTVEQAYREAKYRLRLNQHLVRTVEHSADIDAIACQINDVVLLAHDVPQWGFSGRLLEATKTTLTLDREVTLEPGKSYAVALQVTNPAARTSQEVQSLVTVAVQGVTEETVTNVITLASPLSTVPMKWDLYSFGETNKVVKPFQVLNISRDQDLRRKITCLEYIEDIYKETADIPDINYSALDTTVEVRQVSVAEETYRQKDGTMISNLNVSWNIPRTTAISSYKVLYSDDNGSTWTEWRTGLITQSTTISGVKTATTYLVKVCTINSFGVVSKGVQASIYVAGKDLPPTDVAGLAASLDVVDVTKVKLSWPAVADIDLAGYRIREGATVLENLAQITTYSYAATESRAYTFSVTAVDNSGNESVVAAAATVQVTVEPSVVQGFVINQRLSDRSYVDMTWKANADAGLSHYEIRMSDKEDWDSAQVIASQLKATSFSYQLAVEGYTYFFIKAVNSSGYYSKNAAEAALQVVLKPDAVSQLTAVQSAKDKSMILLTWDAVKGEDIAGYRVTTKDGAYMTKELTYRYEAREDVTYMFAVQAVTIAGYVSKTTNCSLAVTIAAEDVNGLTVQQSGTDRTKVILTWAAPAELDVAYYIIKAGTAWETASVLATRITGTRFETSVTEETEQTFLIKAVTLAGNESQYPAQVSGIFNLHPDPVTNLVVTQSATDTSVLNIAWTGILESDLAYYDVRVGSSWEEAVPIATTQETSCTYTVRASGAVKILIKAMNVAKFYSDETVATLYCTVEPAAISNFRVYQNGAYVELYWDKAVETDVTGYEIREGSGFSGGSLVVTGQTTTSYKYMVDTERMYRYHIKAINKGGFYSITAANANVLVDDLPARNVIEAFDEFALQSGTHDNTAFQTSQYKFSNLGGKFSDYPTTRFSEIGGSTVLTLAKNDSEYCSSGTYTCKQLDIGQTLTANITSYFVSSVFMVPGTSATLQYRTSRDGSAFTEWQDFTTVQATFRYLEFRVLLATTDIAKTPEVNHLVISVDVPESELCVTADIAAGGTTIPYGRTFYTVPVVTPTAVGEDLHAQVIEKNTTGATIKVKDSSNNDVGGTVDLLIRGY